MNCRHGRDRTIELHGLFEATELCNEIANILDTQGFVLHVSSLLGEN